MSAITLVTSAQFRPAHATIEMEQKLRKIGQMFWTIREAQALLDADPSYGKAYALQKLLEERRELIRSLPLYAVE